MVFPLAASRPPVRALVVDSDSQARERFCEALTRRGIEVCPCSSHSQGREFFDAQPIVLARSPGRGIGGSEFNGFVDWVRERAGGSQPYIVAIDDETGETRDAMTSAAANPGCNAVMATPGDDRAMEESLSVIDRWLDSCRQQAVKPREVVIPSRSRIDSPFLKVPDESVVPLEGQVVYSNVLVEHAPLAMAMFDTKMSYLVANQKWRQEFNLEEVEFSGRCLYDVFPLLPENWRRLVEGCLAEGVAERSTEDRFLRADGSSDWVRWEVCPWRQADGTVGGVIVTSEIITERKLREERLIDERDRYATVSENLPVGIVLLDREGKVVYCNAQHAAVLGFDASESADVESWLRRGCPDGDCAQEVMEAWRENVWRKQLPKVLALVTSEGLLKDVRFDSMLLKDGNLLVSFSDVTEARRLEDALHASEAKCRAFFQGSCVGMALVDRGGEFFDINSVLEGMLGYPRWELRSKSLSTFICADDLAGLEAIDPVSAGSDARIQEIEVRLIRKNRRLVWVRLTASPVRDPDGNLLFTAYSVCDIEEQLRAKRDSNRRRLLETTGVRVESHLMTV